MSRNCSAKQLEAVQNRLNSADTICSGLVKLCAVQTAINFLSRKAGGFGVGKQDTLLSAVAQGLGSKSAALWRRFWPTSVVLEMS
jgi:hypothetical protein